MKIIDCVQGTPQWLAARLGIATASRFSDIITPVKGDPSDSMDCYEDEIVGEIISGESGEEFGGTKWTERGKEFEPEAVAYYELERNLDVTHVGFITNDEGTYGASPDGFAGEDGLIEIKCLSLKKHLSVFFNNKKAILHRPQIQGQLLVTGRKWVDNIFYHPKSPKQVIIRVERDEEYIKKLELALTVMATNIELKLKKIRGEI